jgi:hypothetical protein
MIMHGSYSGDKENHFNLLSELRGADYSKNFVLDM